MDVDLKNIETKEYRNDWALALMSQGIIVRLTINRWRGSSKLLPEGLGLKFSDKTSREVTEKYIRLGREKLIPPDLENKLTAIEKRARKNLSKYSYSTVWGKFVPFTAFDKWEEENEKIKKDFFSISEYIGQNYKHITNTVKEAYAHMAQDVWSRLYPLKGDAPASFVENFSNKTKDKIPSMCEIVSSFKYESTYFVIPMPSIIEENLLKAERKKQERELLSFETDLEKKAREKISKQYVERKQDLIDSFLNSTVEHMRKSVGELCNSILESLSKNKTNSISKKQKDKIKKTIQDVEDLNFYDDKEITTLLRNLEGEIDRFIDERDNDRIQLALQEIVDVSSESFSPTKFNPSISTLEI